MTYFNLDEDFNFQYQHNFQFNLFNDEEFKCPFQFYESIYISNTAPFSQCQTSLQDPTSFQKLNSGIDLFSGQQLFNSDALKIQLKPSPLPNHELQKPHLVKQKPSKDKNICRYITRTAIRNFKKQQYEYKVLEFCEGDRDLYEDSTSFFSRKIEYITGFRSLKEYLILNKSDTEEIQRSKQVFRKFFKWFLKERYIRHILNGKMDNKEQYLNYKNKVMLKFIERPVDWNSNKV